MGMTDFRKNMFGTLDGITKEEMNVDPKPEGGGGKYFSDPGIYSVQVTELVKTTSASGKAYSYFKVEDPAGRTGKVMINVRSKEGAPKEYSLWKLFGSMGVDMPFGIVSMAFPVLETAMEHLAPQNVDVRVSFKGWRVKYIEKGNWQIVSEGGKAYVDPTSGEEMHFGSADEVKGYAQVYSIPLSFAELTILQTTGDPVRTKDQIELIEVIADIVAAVEKEGKLSGVVPAKAAVKPAAPSFAPAKTTAKTATPPPWVKPAAPTAAEEEVPF